MDTAKPMVFTLYRKQIELVERVACIVGSKSLALRTLLDFAEENLPPLNRHNTPIIKNCQDPQKEVA